MQKVCTPELSQEKSQAIWSSMLSEIEAQGLNRYRELRAVIKTLVLGLALSFFLYLAWTQVSALGLFLSCIGLTFVVAQFAFLGHDAGHGSLCKNKNLNDIFGQIAMTVVAGISFKEWYSRHQLHHRFCQYEKKDPDMEIQMFVSLTKSAKEEKKPNVLWMTKIQHFHVWFLAFFFGLSQRHLSQFGAILEPKKYWRDLLFLGVHLFLWLGLPYFFLGIEIGPILGVYFLSVVLIGPYLAAIFWVNHIGMPLIENPEKVSFLEHQAKTSRTVNNPKFMDWFFGGLNYQIEHHLYPQIPSYALKKVQPIVMDQFSRNSIGYNGVSFRSACRSVAKHFREVASS